MKKIKLLFVEDDSSFAFVTKGVLELTKLYEVKIASNGEEGLKYYRNFHPDVIVSDVEMPGMNGMDLIQKIRRHDEDIPIIFATGRTSAQDLLDGYQLNVDSFIKKPFIPQELDAHIRALMKRVHKYEIKNMGGKVNIGDYIFTVESETLSWKGQNIKLTNLETQILRKLYENRNNTVPRDKLLVEFWGEDDFFKSRSLDVIVVKLRKHLAKDPLVRIETIRKKGLELKISRRLICDNERA